MSNYTPTADALQEADYIIECLKNMEEGVDYSAGRNEIARMFDEYIWNGCTDITTSFDECEPGEGQGLRDLLLIQEDHYDQHMDHDEDKPTWDSMLFMAGAYVWFADCTS
jgi:hypothetical protein